MFSLGQQLLPLERSNNGEELWVIFRVQAGTPPLVLPQVLRDKWVLVALPYINVTFAVKGKWTLRLESIQMEKIAFDAGIHVQEILQMKDHCSKCDFHVSNLSPKPTDVIPYLQLLRLCVYY